jgi:hypothetical protein
MQVYINTNTSATFSGEASAAHFKVLAYAFETRLADVFGLVFVALT